MVVVTFSLYLLNNVIKTLIVSLQLHLLLFLSFYKDLIAAGGIPTHNLAELMLKAAQLAAPLDLKLENRALSFHI